MLLDILLKFNWVDILVLVLAGRICYVALKTGFSLEFFKLLGTIAALYFSLHYYTSLSDFLRHRFAAPNIPLEFLDFIYFIFMVAAVYFIFVLIRNAFCRVLKLEAVPNLNKWGAFVLGIFRSFLTLALAMYLLVISSTTYLKSSVQGSFMGNRLFKAAPAVYLFIWSNITEKFFAAEKPNNVVLEVRDGIERK